jgi:hypothetical protein
VRSAGYQRLEQLLLQVKLLHPEDSAKDEGKAPAQEGVEMED